MRPEAAALEVEAGAAVEPAGVVLVLAAALPVLVVLPAGAEALPLAAVEVLARVNGIELGAVAVPVGVIPAMQQNKNG
jgi:hypothetical protein